MEALRRGRGTGSALLRYEDGERVRVGEDSDWLKWERATVAARDFEAGKGKPR